MVGETVPKNQVECLRWLRMAAYNGDHSSEMYLGRVLLTSDKPETERRALELLRRAYEWGGQSEAGALLARNLYRGTGGNPPNPKAAQDLIRAKAEAGNVTLMAAMAVVTDDKQEKLRWLRRAAEKGDEDAKSDLAFEENLRGSERHQAKLKRLYREVNHVFHRLSFVWCCVVIWVANAMRCDAL